MFKTIANAWRIEDIRKKLLYTALILFIFRIGAAIPVPFVNAAEGIISNTDTSSFISYLIMMTGDAFNYGTIFAMSITPYINASIILQLLQVVIPALERLAQEGEEGERRFPPSQDILPSVSDFSRAPLTMYISEAAVSLPQTMRARSSQVSPRFFRLS